MFFAIFAFVSFTAAAQQETPASIYAKILDKSCIGKYKSIIVDKEIVSTQLPKGMIIKSKTYYSGGKFREESKAKEANGQEINITTIFTSSDTYMSYDAGKHYFSMGSVFIDEINSIIKNIDPFTHSASLSEKLETINGAECYVIEDNGGGSDRKVYVEKKTFNVIKNIVSREDMLIVTDMSDYSKVDKYSAPRAIKVLVQQKTGDKNVIETEIKLSSIQFNPAINADMFIPANVSVFPQIPGMSVQDMLQSLF